MSLCLYYFEFSESVDVNVTPDKRQVFLEHEKLLLAIIKVMVLFTNEKIDIVYIWILP